MNICSYSYDEYVHLVTSFHGNPAPGLIIGGFMVDMALKQLPQGQLYDAICETSTCLPDAIQILTPCTIGNGWLKVMNFGRYALCLYEKYGGAGVRVAIDPARLDAWPGIREWFLKLKPKAEQDRERLQEEVRDAGASILSLRPVQIKPELMGRKKGKGVIVICPECGEPFPARDGKACLACQGSSPYAQDIAPLDRLPKVPRPNLTAVPEE